jgi:AraC-like DNA-binding protein
MGGEVAMQRVVFSTDEVPEAERFSYWAEAAEGLFGSSAERNKAQETPFKARVVASIAPCVAHFRFDMDGYAMVRRARNVARFGGEDHISIYREMGGGVCFHDHRSEVVSKRGDVVIRDPTLPFVAEPRADYAAEVWLVPRALFEPHLPASLDPRFHVLGNDGLGRMVRAYLDVLTGQLDSLDDRETEIVADSLCRLLAAACGGDQQPEATRLARLAQAQRYVSLHLSDPGLTPEKVAGALKVSVRQLHLLFEPSGTSFSQYVLRRRLEACRSMLLNPIQNRSVTDVAFAWGFGSVRTFNRAFRQAFGAAPGELRVRSEEPSLNS